MKLIISGGLGHIGSFLLEKFNNDTKFKKILIIDNVISDKYGIYFKLNKKKNKLIKKDISTYNLNLIKERYDCFIHLAGVTNAEKSFENKNFLKQNNIGATKNVISYCKNKNLPLIFTSSTSVYGKSFKIINSKNNHKNLMAQSPYAESKIKEERLIKKKLKKYIILRLGTIVGFSEGIRFHTAVNKFCLQASLNQPITIWKKFYKKKRPYLNISDCYNVIKYLLEKKYYSNEVIDIVSKNLTVEELEKKISKIKKINKIFVNTKILNQNSYEVNPDKIKYLGLKFNDIDKEIRRTLDKLI